MKILFSIKAMDDIKGGAERVLADISAGLAERNHDVSLLSFDKEGGQSFYPLHKNIKRICLGIGDAHRQAKLGETLRRVRAVRCIIKAERPDIVIAFMHSTFIPVTVALLGTGIPVIASEHIVPAHYKTRKLQFMLLILSGLAAKRITVLTDGIKSLYPKILQGRMEVVPNPILMPKNLDHIHRSRKIILNIGRLTEQKNQKTLIEAFTKLAPKFPDWDVRIIGEGHLQGKLKKLIADLRLENRVFLAGTTKEIHKEYLGADIFALPSLYEGFGLVTVEAMSYGLPAIGFADCPGTNELIENNYNGLLVDGADRILSFSKGLEELMSLKDLRQKLGEGGIKTAKKFAPQKIISLWEDLIRRVVA
jgi:glycosyltransferase involved in cell wall biosynthesis